MCWPTTLASGLGAHAEEVRRRVPGASVVVQVDEPGLRSVLEGQVPTASGAGRHRRVHGPEADTALREVADAARGAGTRPVVHACAPQVPLSLLAGAGFEAISFDLGLVSGEERDAYASVLESGVDLWPGVADDDASAMRRMLPAVRSCSARWCCWP